MNSYVLQCCDNKDKFRHFNIIGVFGSIEHAKEYITQKDEFDHFIDEYYSAAPCQARRVYMSW
tara:strand:+ start:1721 stop:1909 length:189 start_codon:yes stop_codon:yes gene_type:complete